MIDWEEEHDIVLSQLANCFSLFFDWLKVEDGK